MRGFYVAIKATSTSVLNDLRDAHNESHLAGLMGKKHRLPFSIAKRDDDVTELFTSPDESDEPRIRLLLLPLSPAQLTREMTPSFHALHPGVDASGALMPYLPEERRRLILSSFYPLEALVSLIVEVREGTYPAQ